MLCAKIVYHCALLSFNCGETVLERSLNQDLRVQHKRKKKRKHIVKCFFKEKNMTKLETQKNLESVRILKTQIVGGRNTITKFNCDKLQTKKNSYFFNVDQTN